MGSSLRQQDYTRAACRAVEDALWHNSLSIADAFGLVAGAKMTIGVDTGLTHLSAILGMPTIELYCDSPRWKTEGYWSSNIHNLGDKGEPPTTQEVINIIQSHFS